MKLVRSCDLRCGWCKALCVWPRDFPDTDKAKCRACALLDDADVQSEFFYLGLAAVILAAFVVGAVYCIYLR